MSIKKFKLHHYIIFTIENQDFFWGFFRVSRRYMETIWKQQREGPKGYQPSGFGGPSPPSSHPTYIIRIFNLDVYEICIRECLTNGS
jgi:phosphatidylethanolamine-binding protein (PEBP) family uncharacterized protein